MKIAPSILNADFYELGYHVDIIKDVIDYLHIDVMDGHFVPNISIGVPVVESLKKHYDLPIDTHLMITNPYDYIEAFYKAGSDLITFHLEANSDINKTIDLIHSLGIKAGLSIKPKTGVDELKPYLDKLDLVLVMSVEPGFGGQKFLDSATDKINELKALREKNGYHYLISVDGGINLETISKVKNSDIVVLGSYTFKNDDHKKAILDILEALK